jgi:hypothetical protein
MYLHRKYFIVNSLVFESWRAHLVKDSVRHTYDTEDIHVEQILRLRQRRFLGSANQ